MTRPVHVIALLLAAMPAAAAEAATVVVGTAPLTHPVGGQFVGRLHLDSTQNWWNSAHSGTLEGSGFTWTYDPQGFGEGFSKTFEVQNAARPNLTKVLTLTMVVRQPWVPPPLTEYCADRRDCSSGRDWDFWGGAYVDLGPFPTPFLLWGASNIGQDAETGFWSGQFQFRVSPQPAAEYVTFERSDWGAVVDDIVSMTLQISCVPEPSTWATMMLGFGVVGGAARRRRRGLTMAGSA